MRTVAPEVLRCELASSDPSTATYLTHVLHWSSEISLSLSFPLCKRGLIITC